MRCPNGDDELHARSITTQQGLQARYSVCPTCRGHWMDSLNANFLQESDVRSDKTSREDAYEATPACPVCQEQLIRTTGENIPPEAMVWECPERHGYFFPAGELKKYKAAQSAKISYFKLWNIPLASITSVLLASLTFVVLTGGLVFTYSQVFKPQTTETKAAPIFDSQLVVVSAPSRSAAFSVSTGVTASVVLHVDYAPATSLLMDTKDQKTHTVSVLEMAPGDYTYFFTIHEPSGRVTTTESFQFHMP